MELTAAPFAITPLGRWALLLGGLACFGLGIGLMVQAHVGLSPWDVLHQGLSERTGFQIGTISIFMGLPIMLAWLPLGQRPGWGTLVNVVMLGIFTNIALAVLPSVSTLPLQFIQMIAGVIVIGVGSALYLSAEMGAGPRDGLMLGLTRRTGWSLRLTRTLIELAVLACGWLLGGTVGIGTLAFAFGVGPAVQATLWAFKAAGSNRKDVV